MRRERCVWGFSVRVILSDRCWTVETRNHGWQKTRASVLHDARYYRIAVKSSREPEPAHGPTRPLCRRRSTSDLLAASNASRSPQEE